MYTYIYVWIYENSGYVRATTLTVFRKIQGNFHSISQRQPVNTQFTRPPCSCLAGWLPATKPSGHDRQRLSYKENKQFR